MEDYQRFLNPWVLHLQKMSLELKCPLCLNLFNRPMLLPCNHIFCNFCVPRKTQFGSECPACKHQYVEREIRQAPYMENILNIYRSLDATISASLFQSVSMDTGRAPEQCPISVDTNADDKLRKKHIEAPQEGNSSNGQSICSLTDNKCALNDCVKDGIEVSGKTVKSTILRSGQGEELEMIGGGEMVFNGEDTLIPSRFPVLVGDEMHMELGTVDIDMIQMEQMSPGSPPSFGDTKDKDSNSSDPGSSKDSVEKSTTKRLAENYLDRDIAEMNNSCTVGAKCHARNVKRQKNLNNGYFEMGVKSNGQSQPKSLCPEIITSDFKLEPKSGEPDSSVQSTAISDSSYVNRSVCAFCYSSKITDGTGGMLCYANGKEVVGDLATFSKVIHVHSKCIDWTPQVYYKDDEIKNLESELARAAKLKCSSCGKKGASLGCFVKSCRKSYHTPCALEIDCRWDCEDFLMLCPIHKSVQFPREKSKSGKHGSVKKHLVSTQIISKQSNFRAMPDGVKEWVFCGSALSSEEKYRLANFASSYGAIMSRCWKPNVTHVIAATDGNGACTRTLKVLMAILNGRWILTVDWIKACIEAKQAVDEEPYEVNLDNHGCCGGPKTGRLRVLNNAPKLFNNLKFYFSGDFMPAYKNDLLKLVITAGGTVIENRVDLVAQRQGGQATLTTTLVVYNIDPPQRCLLGEEGPIVLQRLEEAKGLADEIGSRAIKQTWILDSIAACKLQPLP